MSAIIFNVLPSKRFVCRIVGMFFEEFTGWISKGLWDLNNSKSRIAESESAVERLQRLSTAVKGQRKCNIPTTLCTAKTTLMSLP